MITRDNLPFGYVPFPELSVCSNRFVNGIAIFELGDKIPLLVGKGEKPLIWLEIPSPFSKESWYPVINASKSIRPEFRIDATEQNEESVVVKDHLILKVICKSENFAEITKLDLRPVGFNIYGDQTGLTVVKSRLSNNSFKNVKIMIAMAAPTKS